MSSCGPGGKRTDLPGMIPLLVGVSSVHEGCVAAAPESVWGQNRSVKRCCPAACAFFHDKLFEDFPVCVGQRMVLQVWLQVIISETHHTKWNLGGSTVSEVILAELLVCPLRKAPHLCKHG